MYETYLRRLFRLRTEYWQIESTSLRNLKLSQMVLFANACGRDLMEFVSEEAPEKSDSKAESKPKAAEKAKMKAAVPPKKAKAYECPNCDFITASPKALSGHMKKHSSKYQTISDTQ
ncbi:MAG: C2H2-type zinc finger protein [Spirosomataceae bacterium]